MPDLSFGPIQLDQQDAYGSLFKSSKAIASDYSFINLWSWAESYGLQWAWEDQLVWIRQTIPETVLWAPIGNWAKVEWEKRFSAVSDVSPAFIRIQEQLLSIWKKAFPGRIREEKRVVSGITCIP